MAPDETQKAIGDAYDAGYARGGKVMLHYLLTVLAPLTPEQQKFFGRMCEMGDALGLTGKDAD